MSWLPYIPGFLVRLVVSLNRDKPRGIAFYVIKKLFSVKSIFAVTNLFKYSFLSCKLMEQVIVII